MMKRNSIARLLAGVLVILTGAGLMAREDRSIRVPEGNGRPILIDGIFTPGEWDDALSLDIRPNLKLLLKKSAGFVFIGLKYSEFNAYGQHGSVDLLISPDGKAVRQFHVSAQMGERWLNDTPGLEDDPPFDWGDTSDWYANEERWSERKIEALVKEGKNPGEAKRLSFYKSDGFEFQIRRSKFGTDEWFLRLRVFSLPDWKPEFLPKDSAEATTAGWFKLVFK